METFHPRDGSHWVTLSHTCTYASIFAHTFTPFTELVRAQALPVREPELQDDLGEGPTWGALTAYIHPGAESGTESSSLENESFSSVGVYQSASSLGYMLRKYNPEEDFELWEL